MQIDGAGAAKAKATSYLVGPALDEAEAAGEDLEIYWPFEDSHISQWAQAEAIW